MIITPESPIGEIAARYPLATRVLARHQIDFCCGGDLPVAEACARRGLDAGALIAEIESLGAGRPEPSWRAASTAELVEHIVRRYHAPLREELPRLETMARKVARVHADRDPRGRLAAILETFVGFSRELEDHMAREEADLFPLLVAGAPSGDLAPFVNEHEAAGEALARLRHLTDGYVVPAGACATWRALWAGLADLERTMHEHVHLENNILFRRGSSIRPGT
jgi:regulator of cell morphogenesis and NO signaling